MNNNPNNPRNLNPNRHSLRHMIRNDQFRIQGIDLNTSTDGSSPNITPNSTTLHSSFENDTSNENRNFNRRLILTRNIRKRSRNFHRIRARLQNLLSQKIRENLDMRRRLRNMRIRIRRRINIIEKLQRSIERRDREIRERERAQNRARPQNQERQNRNSIFVESRYDEAAEALLERPLGNRRLRLRIEPLVLTENNFRRYPSYFFFRASADSYYEENCRRQPIKKRIRPLVTENLVNLHKFLLKYLLNEVIFDQDIGELTPLETNIIKWFLRKKQLLNERTFDKPLTVDHLNQIKPHCSRKIDEEKLKFVLLNSLNYMKKIWLKKSKRGNRRVKVLKIFRDLNPKSKLDLTFYLHYFGEMAFLHRKFLPRYFHPQKSFQNNPSIFSVEEINSRPRTITRAYIQDLKTSRRFMADFKAFLSGTLRVEDGENYGFLELMKIDIKNKLTDKVNKWERDLRERGQNTIQQNLLNNSKCKLPWFLLNVCDAITHTKKRFGIN